MKDVVWLASYPKSGNTWLRLLLASLTMRQDQAFDINDIAEYNFIASARILFDSLLLIDSGLLTHDEIDNLRPRLYEDLAQTDRPEGDEGEAEGQAIRFIKLHDACTRTLAGEPLFAGTRGAKGAVVIVRDPRSIAPSLASHRDLPIDEAIAVMNDPNAMLASAENQQPKQLRQKLLDWSGHIASWLDQDELPVHLVRYEDMQRDTIGALLGVTRFAGLEISPADAARVVALADFEKLQAQERAMGFSEWFDRSGKGGLFFRRGKTAGWRDELTDGQVARIERAHAPMMARLGYELSGEV